MSEQILDWINFKLKMNLSLNDLEKTFSNGYYFGLILFYYNFNPSFFDIFNNKYQKIYIDNNYKKWKEIFPFINLKLDNSNIKMLINEDKGIAQKLLFDMKNNLEKFENNLKIKNKTGMKDNEFIFHKKLQERNLTNKAYNIERKLIKYQNNYNELKNKAFKEQNMEYNKIKEFYSKKRDNMLNKMRIKTNFIKDWDNERKNVWKETINNYNENREYERNFLNKMTDKLIKKSEYLTNKDKLDFTNGLKEFDKISIKFGLGFENKDGSYNPEKKDDINIEANMQKIKERVQLRENIQKEKRKNERKVNIEKLKFEEEKKIELELKNKLENFNKININKSKEFLNDRFKNYQKWFYNKNIEKFLLEKKLERKQINLKISKSKDKNIINDIKNQKIFELRNQIFDKRFNKYERNYNIMKIILSKFMVCAEKIHESMERKKDNQITNDFYKKIINIYLFNEKIDDDFLKTQNNNFNNTDGSNLNYNNVEINQYLKLYIKGKKSFLNIKNYSKFFKLKDNNYIFNVELNHIYKDIFDNNIYLNYFELIKEGIIYEAPKILYYGNNIDNLINSLEFEKIKVIDIDKIYEKLKNNYEKFMEEYNIRKKKLKKNEPEEEITDEKILFFEKIKNKEELSNDDKFEILEIHIKKYKANKLNFINQDFNKEKIFIFKNFPNSLEDLQKLDNNYGNFKNIEKLFNKEYSYFVALINKLNNYKLKRQFEKYEIGFFDLIINDINFENNSKINSSKTINENDNLKNEVKTSKNENNIDLDNEKDSKIYIKEQLKESNVNYLKIFGIENKLNNNSIYVDTISENINDLIIKIWEYRKKFYYDNEKNSVNKKENKITDSKKKSMLLIKKTTFIKTNKSIVFEKTKKNLQNLKNFEKNYFRKLEIELIKFKSNYNNIKESLSEKNKIIKNKFENISKIFNKINKFIFSYNNFTSDNPILINKEYTKNKLVEKIKTLDSDFWDQILNFKNQSLDILNKFKNIQNWDVFFYKIFKNYMNINVAEINRIYFLVKLYNKFKKEKISIPELELNENNIPEKFFEINNISKFFQIEYLNKFIFDYIQKIKNKLDNIELFKIEINNVEKRLKRLCNYTNNKLIKIIIYFFWTCNFINDSISFYLKDLNDIFLRIFNLIKENINKEEKIDNKLIESIYSSQKKKFINFSEYIKIELINKRIIKSFFLLIDFKVYFNNDNEIEIKDLIKYLNSRILIKEKNIIGYKILPSKLYKMRNNNMIDFFKKFNQNNKINLNFFLIFILLMDYPILKSEQEIIKLKNLNNIIWLDEYDEKLNKELNPNTIYSTFYNKKFLNIIINNDIEILKKFLYLFKNSEFKLYKDVLKSYK